MAENNKFILSRQWKQEIQNQNMSRVDSFWRPWVWTGPLAPGERWRLWRPLAVAEWWLQSPPPSSHGRHPPSLCIHLPFSSLDLLLDLGLILVWGSLITRSFTQVHLQRPWVQVRLCSEVPGGRSFCRAEYSSKHYILWQLLCSFFFESFFNWQTRRSPSLYPSSFSSNNSS